MGSKSGVCTSLDPSFDAFLFAPVGEEKTAMVLTVLSALARLGVDPWQESERLAQLPPEAAIQRLAAIISGVSSGQWAAADAGAIAERLVKLLPAQRVFDLPARLPVVRPSTVKAQIAMVLFFVALGGLILFAVSGRARSATDVDAGRAGFAALALPAPPVADLRNPSEE